MEVVYAFVLVDGFWRSLMGRRHYLRGSQCSLMLWDNGEVVF